MNKKNYVVGVDFGTSTLTMAVGSVDESGLVHVENVLSEPSRGIEGGVIQNINDVSEVLRKLKADIESGLNISIHEAYAGVSGPFIYYETYSDHVFVRDRESGIVSTADVEALYQRMQGVTGEEGEEVMDRYPLNFMIDHHREVTNPVGAFSRQLSSTFALIVSRREPLSRLHMVFRNSGMRLAGVYANSAVMSEAVLSEDEKNEGAAVIDLGGATTNLAVCQGGLVRYAASIPLGGKAVDSDIKKHGVAIRDIEKLKKEFGSAVAENVPEGEEIRIKGVRGLMRRNLATIIEARLMDIIDYVKAELKDSGYDRKLPYGLVLTGGMASIPDIEALFAQHTGREVRVATACYGIDSASCVRIDSTEYTSVVALLISAAKEPGLRSAADDVEAVTNREEPSEVTVASEPERVPGGFGQGGVVFAVPYGDDKDDEKRPGDNDGGRDDNRTDDDTDSENKEEDNNDGGDDSSGGRSGFLGKLGRRIKNISRNLENMFDDTADVRIDGDDFYVHGNDKEEL